jgi:hypothetical protein
MADRNKITVDDTSDHPDYHRIKAARDSMPGNATLPQILDALRIDKESAFAFAVQRARLMCEHMDWEENLQSRVTNMGSAYMEGFLVGVMFGEERATPVFDAVDGDTSHRGQ